MKNPPSEGFYVHFYSFILCCHAHLGLSGTQEGASPHILVIRVVVRISVVPVVLFEGQKQSYSRRKRLIF